MIPLIGLTKGNICAEVFAQAQILGGADYAILSVFHLRKSLVYWVASISYWKPGRVYRKIYYLSAPDTVSADARISHLSRFRI